jgi:adenylylsulfate kinase-like enzyme
MVYLITGKAGAGKTHYAEALAKELMEEGYQVRMLDGDTFRAKTKNKDYTDKGRIANLVKAARQSREWEWNGYIVILSFIAPQKEWRDMMRTFWLESRIIYIPGGTLWKGTTYEKPTDDELINIGRSEKWRERLLQKLDK